MLEFIYNNVKNIITKYIVFMLNDNYYSCIFFKNNINPCLKSYSANRLLSELKKLISIC